MFNRQFVSIVFSDSHIQIILLNSEKNKIVSINEIPVPQGLIVNHRVQNIEAIAQILKENWRAMKLTEKSVGIVIPEFSTYTKQLVLPRLSKGELTEAVLWQAQDFLPVAVSEMVMDWEVIGEKDDTVQILVTAIARTVLSGYVDAVSRAGLFPVVIETPSLSLTRLSGEDDMTKLLIYISSEEAVLVVCRGQNILGSSVSNASSSEDIIATAARILRHYQSINIQKILLGGNIPANFPQLFQKQTSIPMEMLNVTVAGLTPEQLQFYLIGISLQFKDPDQPSSERTINLLPPSWEKHYKDKLEQIEIWTFSLFCSFIVIAGFVSVVLTYMLMLNQKTAFAEKIELQSQTVDDESINRAKEVNVLAKQIITVDESTLSFYELFGDVAKARFAGISVNKYDFDLENGLITLAGQSFDRQALIKFKQNLESVDSFAEVNLPVTNLLEGQNLNFAILIKVEMQKEASAPKLKL